MIYFNVTLDVSGSNVLLPYFARIDDINSHTIKATVNTDLTNKTISVSIKRPDDQVVVDIANVTGTNTFEYLINNSALEIPGLLEVEFSIVGIDYQATTQKIIFQVLDRIDTSEIVTDLYNYPILVQLINDVQVIDEQEQLRIASENIRITNEATRQSQESVRITSEQTRSSAETSRVTAESTRSSNENARNTAETIRNSNETARQSAESLRSTTESSRISAETARGEAETLRVSAENSRNQAESLRSSSETSRISAESNRESAESTRVQNEDLRISNESARQSAESNRETIESNRVIAENIRNTNESERILAEQTRVLSESSRVSAESVRQQVMDDFQTNIEAIQTSAQTATTKADLAIISAQNASISETNAKNSETSADEDAAIAAQAMADLLAMLGNDIATLTDGKLTPSQIPAISINDTFPVESEMEIIELNAQRGDVAIIVTNEVVTDSYILAADDPTNISNWKKLGVSYVAQAGNAQTALYAENADKINNKRMIAMTQSQYDVAVKEPDTIYIVG